MFTFCPCADSRDQEKMIAKQKENLYKLSFQEKDAMGHFNMDFTSEAMILSASAEKMGERAEASSKEFNGTLREFNTTLRYGIFGFAFTALGVAFIFKGRPAKLVPRFMGHK